MTDEIAVIKKNVDEFLTKNQENFEIIAQFQNQIVNLTQDNFSEAIQLIQNHKNVFFKDHGTTFTFIYYIVRAALFNFKKLELVFDICIHFGNEIRNTITEYEILAIFSAYQISISYLFSKQFFSIESIFKNTLCNNELFVNFLPEIEEYDPEYAKVRLKTFLENCRNPMYKKIYEDVKADPQKHIANRSACYHPSPLHKCIREDDIDTFQSLLYKNNYGVNYEIEFSIYERAQTIDSNLSLIQIAATYGSIKIFKFLWMQTDIKPPENLLLYAFFGCNNEIIHICEEKLPDKKAVLQTIYLNRLDFLDYYIENFSDQFKENEEEIKKILTRYQSNDDKEDSYDELNSEQLYAAVDFYTVPVIKSALCKICFIVKNIELNNELHKSFQHSLLIASLPHFELFKFLYMQRDPNEDAADCESYFSCIEKSIIFLAFDSFVFLLDELKDYINFHSIFSKSIYYSRYSITNYLLDLSIEEIESDPENAPICSEISESISINELIIQIQNYNEEIIVKMIRLFNFFIDGDDVLSVVKYLNEYATTKMIIELFKKIMQYLDQNTVNQFASAFENYDKAVADFIKKS